MHNEDESNSLRTLELELWGPEGPGGERHWPAEELSADRWARARKLGFGEDSCVHHSCYIYGSVVAGKHIWVGPFALLDATGGLTMGDFVMICAGVQVYSHDSVQWALSGGWASYEKSAVKIGSRCYIGAGSIITRGVTIGDGCVVGAGSLVNRDLPSGTIAAGSPARVIGRVELEEDGGLRFVRINTPSTKV